MEVVENKISIHPFEPFIPNNATKLIIGTIPPYRFCKQEGVEPNLSSDDVNFYYGSHDNSFWELVYASSCGKTEELIKENSKEAVDQRKALLEKMGIGITDIVEQCYHKDQKSDDKSLMNIKQKDIRKLLSENEKIDTLIYTSDFVKSQMNAICDDGYHSSVDKKNRIWSVRINGKKYRVVILYSPSPNALRRINAETRQRQYDGVFGKNNSL